MAKRIKSLSNQELADYISRQLNHFFPDKDVVDAGVLEQYIDVAEDRVFKCFDGILKKYFNDGESTTFNHLQSDQYCMYLYMLANSIHRTNGDAKISTKLYYLNKSLHSVDIYFTSQLPDIFLLVHPLGTIMGRAAFGDYFVAYQGCTVGCLNKGIFPTIGDKVIMYANSDILGTCTIGNNVCIGAGVSVINTDVPNDVVVLGKYPDYRFLPNSKDYWTRPPYLYEASTKA